MLGAPLSTEQAPLRKALDYIRYLLYKRNLIQYKCNLLKLTIMVYNNNISVTTCINKTNSYFKKKKENRYGYIDTDLDIRIY